MDITAILSGLNAVLALQNTSAPPVPTPLVLLSTERPGLSALKTTTTILQRCQQELGSVVGTLPDGSPNKKSKEIQIIVEEIFKAILYESKIQTTIEPFGTIVGAGVTAQGIPVTVTGVVTGIQTGGTTIS